MSKKIPIEELIGRRSGMLEVLGETKPYTAPSGKRTRRLLCRCDCGVEKILHASMVIGGPHNHHLTKSCGCAQYRRSDAQQYKGKSFAEWAELNDIPVETIRRRVKTGWTIEAAVSTPVDKKLSRRIYE